MGEPNMGSEHGSVIVVGAGGHARVVAEAIGRDRIIGYVAPDRGADERGLGEWLGGDDLLRAPRAGASYVIGVGFVDRAGARRRASLLETCRQLTLETVVHPHAVVSSSAELGDGTFVAAGAIVGVSTRIGRGVIVNTGAVVDHDCRIGDNVHLAPGSVLSGSVRIGRDTLVGVGASVRQGITIGSGVVVGAGAAVVHDVADGLTVLGAPARPVDVER
jgi:UDP-perosamine 4-acetyltransferase